MQRQEISSPDTHVGPCHNREWNAIFHTWLAHEVNKPHHKKSGQQDCSKYHPAVQPVGDEQGCDKVWRESLLGDDDVDKAFTKFLDQIAPGDTVIAIRVTSVAHSAADFLNLLERIQNKGAYFKSLAEP